MTKLKLKKKNSKMESDTYVTNHAKRDLIGTPRYNNKIGNEASTGRLWFDNFKVTV